MNKFLAAVALVICLVSCEEAETPSSVIESESFNIQISSYYLGEQQTGYLMMHNQDGYLAAHRTFSNGTQLKLKLDKGEMYHMTIMRKVPMGDVNHFYIETIAGIKIEKDYTIGLKQPNRRRAFDNGGGFEVVVSDQERLGSTTVSSVTGYHSGRSFDSWYQSIAMMNIDKNSEKYFVTTRSQSDELRYSFIPQVKSWERIDINFSEMTHFDKVIKFPRSEGVHLTTSVKVLDKENGEWKDSFWLNTNMLDDHPPKNEYQIGFLNQFEIYETIVDATLPNQLSVGYHKIGNAPSSIQLPINKDITMQSSHITNIQFSSDMAYNNWSGSWRLRDHNRNIIMVWDVWGKESGFKLKNLPDDFILKYPQFSNLQSLRLTAMKLMHSDTEYENLVFRKYVEPDHADETQLYYLQKSFLSVFDSSI